MLFSFLKVKHLQLLSAAFVARLPSQQLSGDFFWPNDMLGLRFDHFFQPSKVEFWRSLGQKIRRNFSGKYPQGFSEASFCDVMCVCVCVSNPVPKGIFIQ